MYNKTKFSSPFFPPISSFSSSIQLYSFSPYEDIYKLPVHLMEERISTGYEIYKFAVKERPDGL